MSSLHVVVLPEKAGDWYHVYIKYTPLKVIDEYPSETTYDYYFTLPTNSSAGTTNANAYEMRHTAFIRANETKGNGTYYIAVKLGSMLIENICCFVSLFILTMFFVRGIFKHCRIERAPSWPD